MSIDISDQARRWVGTPVAPGLRECGVGVDALGLVRAVGEACGVLQVDALQAAAFDNEASAAPGWFTRTWLDSFLRPIAWFPLQPGDVCLLAVRAGAAYDHAGILTRYQGRPYLVHAAPRGGRYLATGQARSVVVEHTFGPPWPQLVAAWYRYPGLDR